MIRLQVALIFPLTFTILVSAAAAEKVPIGRIGATTLRAHSGNRSVEASITTERRRAALYENEDDSTAPERSVVRAIAITMNGQKIIVPRSVTFGLILPNRAELVVGAGISVLTIEGGDTTESYIVRIEFDSERVKRMTAASALIPDKPLQITTFYRQTLEERPPKKQ